jgi:hypothetical protein
MRPYLDDAKLLAMYKIYIWPHLEYGMMGYYHAHPSQLAKLETVQRRFFRSTKIVASALPSLARRRHVGLLCYLYKVIVLRRCSPCVLERLTLEPPSKPSQRTRRAIVRHRYQIHIAYASNRRTDTEIYSRHISLFVTWNNLDSSFFGKGPRHFKERVNAQALQLRL